MPALPLGSGERQHEGEQKAERDGAGQREQHRRRGKFVYNFFQKMKKAV